METQHKELRILMLFKIIHRFVELHLPDYIVPAPHATRGNSVKFIQPATSVNSYAKQKHLGCKKERGQSEATLQTGRRDQKV